MEVPDCAATVIAGTLINFPPRPLGEGRGEGINITSSQGVERASSVAARMPKERKIFYIVKFRSKR